MKKFKSSIMILLLFFFLLANGINVQAQSGTVSETTQQEEVSDLKKAGYVAALSVVINFPKGDEAVISNEYPIVDKDGKQMGVCLGYFVDDSPYGYAIYDFASAKISEFIFEAGIKNLFLEIEECAENDTSSEVNTEKLAGGLIAGDGLDYYVIDTSGNVKSNYDSDVAPMRIDGDKVFDTIGKKTSEESVYSQAASIFDVLKRESDLPAVGTVRDSKKLLANYTKAMFSQAYIENLTSRYACAIVGALGCINRYGYIKQSDLMAAFNELWDNSKTRVYETSKNSEGKYIQYGVNYMYDVATGMTKYFNNHNLNYRAVYRNDDIDNITYVDMKYYIDNNKSPLLAIREHAMAVLGYYSYFPKNSQYYDNYVIVADGWYDDAPKYINYYDVQESEQLEVVYVTYGRSVSYK